MDISGYFAFLSVIARANPRGIAGGAATSLLKWCGFDGLCNLLSRQTRSITSKAMEMRTSSDSSGTVP